MELKTITDIRRRGFPNNFLNWNPAYAKNERMLSTTESHSALLSLPHYHLRQKIPIYVSEENQFAYLEKKIEL